MPNNQDAPQGSAQPDASAGPSPQMQASETQRPPRGVPAAFGTGSGAAIVFRDYASI